MNNLSDEIEKLIDDIAKEQNVSKELAKVIYDLLTDEIEKELEN